jgi:hypothetical protein
MPASQSANNFPTDSSTADSTTAELSTADSSDDDSITTDEHASDFNSPQADYEPKRTNSRLPEFKTISNVSVRLLQGALYSDEPKLWDLCLRNQSQLETYFGRLGLALVIDPLEGLAFLRQATDEESPPGYENLPRLFRKTRLTREATLLCVLLRDLLRQYEEEDIDNELCVVEFDNVLERWAAFFPIDADAIKTRRQLSRQLRKLEEYQFVRQSTAKPDQWEIRRLLKVRLPLDELKRIRDQLSKSFIADGVRSND